MSNKLHWLYFASRPAYIGQYIWWHWLV